MCMSACMHACVCALMHAQLGRRVTDLVWPAGAWPWPFQTEMFCISTNEVCRFMLLLWTNEWANFILKGLQIEVNAAFSCHYRVCLYAFTAMCSVQVSPVPTRYSDQFCWISINQTKSLLAMYQDILKFECGVWYPYSQSASLPENDDFMF